MITDFLLTTKLQIPRLPIQHIKRSRLLTALEEGVQRRLTLVAAPAGSGKTTLLAEWASSTTLPVRWLTLEEAENDPDRLLTYLMAALNPLQGYTETDEQMGGLVAYPQWEPALTRVLNEMTRALKQDAVLILDDYHLLTSESVHTILNFLLDHLPEHLHLVIGTRIDPPWPLARLRAHDQLYEVRSAALDFSSAETEAFMNAMGMPFSEQTRCVLEKITSGWVVGVQLLTLVMRGRRDTASFLERSGTVQHVLQDYIREEILYQQTAYMQRFLLSTSIFERFCAPLCDALLEETDGKGALRELRKANLFLCALDEEGIWYRYHPLFAEVLVRQLKESEPEQIAELYRRASHWYEQQGWIEEACDYALRADDQVHAAALVEKLMPRLIEQGKLLSLRTWFERLSPDVVTTTPLLFLAMLGMQLFVAQNLPLHPQYMLSMVSEQIKQQIARHAQDDDPRWAELEQGIPLVQAIGAMLQGDAPSVFAFVYEAASLERDGSSELGKIFAVLRKIILSNAYGISGNLEVAEQLLRDPLAFGAISRPSRLDIARLPNLVSLYEAQGRLRELASVFEMMLRMPREDNSQPLITRTMMRARYAALLYECNQLDEAEEHARQAWMDNQRFELPIPRVSLLSLRIRVCVALARGEIERAQQLLAREEFQVAHYAGHPTQGNAFIVAGITRVALISELLGQEECWEYLTMMHVEERLASTLTISDYKVAITQARILLARGRRQANNPAPLTQAFALLEKLEVSATTMGNFGWLLEIQVVMVMVLQAQGKVKRAIQMLAKSLAWAEQEGYIRLFADEGEPMALLLTHSELSTTISPGYIQRIQRAMHSFTNHAISSGQAIPSLPLHEMLSPREQEVLMHLSKGLSNQQIAERLVISENTAKRHVKHLLAKLAVTNRTQAVVRARELNWI